MKTLGGATMVYNGISQDYNFIETLNCLYDICDEVSVAFGGDDGTAESVYQWAKNKVGIKLWHFTQQEWDEQVGREKLSYFSNRAIFHIESEYTLYVQCDEVIHENSRLFIREAIETGSPAFMITRHNLWASPFTRLEVEQHRKPCSTEVIRLARRGYYCVGDAESLGVDQCDMSFVDKIVCYHMGFVRDKHKHLTKIRHMQEKVFLWEVDKRIHDNKDGFSPWRWGFTPADVVPIEEPLPKYIKQWAEDRIVPVFQEEDYDLAVKWCRDLNIDLPYLSNERLIEFTNELWYKMSRHYQKITPGTSSEPGV